MKRFDYLTSKPMVWDGLFPGAWWVKEYNVLGESHPSNIFLIRKIDDIMGIRWEYESCNRDDPNWKIGEIKEFNLVSSFRYLSNRDWLRRD